VKEKREAGNGELKEKQAAFVVNAYKPKIDFERSWKYKNEPVLITIEEELLAREEDRLEPFVYEIQDREKLEKITFLPKEAIEELKEYLLTSETSTIAVAEEEETETEELDETEVSRQLQLILLSAKKRGASDIHVIPKEKETRVEFRVNGVLELFRTYPKAYAEYLVNKIKMLAKMDITVSLVPQDGKMKVKIGDEVLELRVSTVPTVYGEDAVMRIQKTQTVFQMELKDLGFEEDDYKKYEDRFTYPYGIILDVGGTGEGKTTTLYLTLKELARRFGERKRILTVEDPVEIYFPQAVQVEVDERQGRTFPKVLRAFLRQDPDIILVGEIRDEETAHISVRASLTGHLVLSTLHATDTFNAITRLKDLGVSPVLLSSTLNVILSQRLVRVLCPNCKKKVKYSPAVVEKYNLDFDEGYEAVGCELCNYTGFIGRTAVIEVLPIDEELKEMIASEVSEVEMKRTLRERGFRNLWANALLKVKRGETSLSEVETKIKPDVVLNKVEKEAVVDLGVIFYPEKKIEVEIKGIKGYLYDISGKGMSVIFSEPHFIEVNAPVKVKVKGKEVQFIPKSYKKLADGKGFIVGGIYRGNLRNLIEE